MTLLDNKKRVITALVLLGIIVLALSVKGWIMAGIAVIVAAIALWEFFDLFWDKPSRIISRIIGIVLASVMIVSAASPYLNLTVALPSVTGILSAVFVVSALLFLFSYGLKNSEAQFKEVFPLLSGTAYIALPLALAFQFTIAEMCLVLLIAIATDTGGYYIGSKFGKHKLWPSVSPKKSWQGSAGGLLVCIIIVLGMALAFSPLPPSTPKASPIAATATVSKPEPAQGNSTETATDAKDLAASADAPQATETSQDGLADPAEVAPADIAPVNASTALPEVLADAPPAHETAADIAQADPAANAVQETAEPNTANKSATGQYNSKSVADAQPSAKTPLFPVSQDQEATQPPLNEQPAPEQTDNKSETGTETATPAPQPEAIETAIVKASSADQDTSAASVTEEVVPNDASQAVESTQAENSPAVDNTPVNGLPSFTLFTWFILAIVLNIAAQFGDFFESALKRSVQVKDTGTLLPGHGGVLDRIDSFLFVVPVYAACKYLLQLCG